MKKNIPWHDASEIMSENKDWPIWICRTHFEYNGLKFSVINGFGTYGGWYGANPGMTEDENNGRNQEIECMIEILRAMNDQNARAVVVEEWIQKNGPLPNKYGEEVRQILMDGQEE